MTLEVGMQGLWGKRRRKAIGAAVTLCLASAIVVSSASAVPPTIVGTKASGVASTSATLEAEVNSQGLSGSYHFEYGTSDCLKSACTSIPVPDVELPAGTSPVQVNMPVEELTPGTVYHFRAVAKNINGTTNGPDRIFSTYANSLVGPPDGRVYEQASPVDKNGGDITGDVPIVKAAATGATISFGSTFGIPGAKGAQVLPTYLALRGAGESGWVAQGLLPPEGTGERAQVIGRSLDDTEVFSKATRIGTPPKTALLAQSPAGGGVTVIAPYTSEAVYSYVGQTPNRSSVFFEATVKLPPKEGKAPIPAAIEGASNLYAWDRASGEISLAGMLNDKTAPPKGAFAGPYDWAKGINGGSLREGGAQRNYYLLADHAITEGGDVFFTEAGTGQLYLRLNPTEEQSPLNGEGKCTDSSLACTIHVSASHKTDGESENGADPAGSQPAAFQAASADGSEVFFISPEKLTNDANTGPEQPEAAISIGGIDGGIENDKLLSEHAVGVAADSEYIYWADPSLGTIGRAKLNGTTVDPSSVDKTFVVPGPVEFEVSPGVKELVESKPRYVAVDAGHVYWTNTGRSDENGEPLDGGGTIGRADIAGTPDSIEPDFIRGASNPQGIAVNASHIYWANSSAERHKSASGIARAKVKDGGGVEQSFQEPSLEGEVPYGVALSPTHLYWTTEQGGGTAFVIRIPFEGGGKEEFLALPQAKIRGVVLDAASVYWAAQGEEAIGRADLELTAASVESKFIEVEGSPTGLAADANHLYWSINGEAPTNPGSDLYRYLPATNTLEDLTTLTGGNGAEVQGMVGAAPDGSYLYFVANGDLDEGGSATAGDCRTSTPHGSVATTAGSCNLYLWHEGKTILVARLRAGGGTKSDAVNWMATPREVFGGGIYVPKTSFLSADGQTLLFRSQEKLSAYDNEGAPEFYRYRVGDLQIRCASCSPSGEASDNGPSLGSITFPGIGPLGTVAAVASRNFSADGNRAFFETAEALSPLDTNGKGEGGCPLSGNQGFPACLDVYEWEAPGTGSCTEGGPSYSPLNAGCIYLISTGKDEFPSLFADASASGDDVFFFTRQQLVGQDKDALQDVYDARVGGGLASQNPTPVIPCPSAEACHEAPQTPPAQSTPATPNFVGPTNPVPKHKKQKAKKHKKGKKHHAKKHKKAKHKGRAGR